MKAWFRLDADLFAHPKFAGIAPAAFMAWAKGLAHCRQFRTDGIIAPLVVPTIANRRIRAELVDRKLWHNRDDGGIDVHDYGTYQPTEADWKAWSEAGKKGAQARWGDGKSHANRMPIASDSDAMAMPSDSDSDSDSEKPSSAAVRRRQVHRALDELFGTLEPGSREEGRRHKAVADLCRYRATYKRVYFAYRRYQQKFPDATVTDIALATHYPQLTMKEAV